jgi:hypothetical protein
LYVPQQREFTYTALGIAVKQGHTDIVMMLIRAGADVNYRDTVRGVCCRLSAGVRASPFAVVETVTNREFIFNSRANFTQGLIARCV